MRSLRGRFARRHALGVLGASVLLAGVLLGTERTVARRGLQRQADDVAAIAVQILAQAGTERFTGVFVTGDSAVGPALSPAVARTLGALPGYVLVADGPRLLFASEAVRRLGAPDRATFVEAATTLLSATRPAAYVQLRDDEVYVKLQVADVDARGGASTRHAPLRVAAAASTEALSLIRLDAFLPIALAILLVTIVSAILAWGVIGAGLEPLERLQATLEDIRHGRSLHRRLRQDEGVAEVDRLAETINAMLARLEASFVALRRFTADASHELKTPLAVFRANIERAMSAPQAVPEQLAPLEEALAESARMADLVESLLTLARADEGRYDIHREPVALEPMILEMYETGTILGEAAGVTVTLLGTEPLTVAGEASRLRQLFLNILTNALKYTPAGGRVSIGLSRRGDQAAVVVDDTGVGIAAPDLPFIFERFWRADRSRSRAEPSGGFGLGLAIAEWIAQAHGGSITVASRPGRGTTMTVLLPAEGRSEGAAGLQESLTDR
jgi:signal transduction histidine kinase